MSGPVADRNVEAVITLMRSRAETGLRKYGTTTERTDLSFLQWVQHLQDELLDAAIYAERLKSDHLAAARADPAVVAVLWELVEVCKDFAHGRKESRSCEAPMRRAIAKGEALITALALPGTGAAAGEEGEKMP